MLRLQESAQRRQADACEINGRGRFALVRIWNEIQQFGKWWQDSVVGHGPKKENGDDAPVTFFSRMDDCTVIPDIWTRIIPLLPLESAATASLVCRYLRALVPTLAKVPQLWRKFAMDEENNMGRAYPNGEGVNKEARVFVRELVRRGLHEVPGLTTYMSLTTMLSGKYIMGFS